MNSSREIRLWKAGVTLGPALTTLFLVAMIGTQHGRTVEWAGEVERSYRVGALLDRVLARLTDAETAERGFIVTGDVRYLEPYQGVRGDVAAALAELRRVTVDPAQRAALDSLGPLVERRLARNDENVRTRRDRGYAAADAAVESGRGRAAMDSVRAAIGRMGRRQSALLAERRAHLRQADGRTDWLLSAAMVASVLLGLGTHLLLRRYTDAQEADARDLAEHNLQLQEQAVELEIQSEQLAAQAVELEGTAVALAESERRFRAMIENSSDIITIVDGEGRVAYQSPAVTRVMGFDTSETVGSLGFDGVHADDRPGMEQLFRELMGGDRDSVTTRVRCRNRAGEWRLIEAMATNLVQDQAIGGIVVNARDITDRHAAEGEVRAQRAYLRAVIDASPSLIFARDSEGRVTMANAAAARMLGTTPDAPPDARQGEPMRSAREAAASRDDDREVLETGRPLFIAEETMTDPWTGEVRWLQTFKVRLTPPAGGEPQVLVVSTDITERKRAEEALKSKEEELRQSQKLEAVGRLAGGVAHDFNNILTAVRGFAQVLLMDVGEDSPIREDLLEIDRAGERGSTLARQLLAFSRKQVMHPRRLDVNEIAAGTHRMLSRLMGEDVELVLDLSREPMPVMADPGELEQVLVNLVVNARDAMPDGGRIMISTRQVAGGGGEFVRGLYVAPGEHGVLLAVSDSGQGMDEPTQERIFEPFFTTKPQGRGTGLGLSTVYGIVNQSGGSIAVQSVPGEGSTFFVLLPRVEGGDEDDAPAKDRPLSHVVPGTTTVLLVEDEDPVRRSVRRMLERYGYHVLDAAGSHEALRICASYPGDVHVLLTDVVMPGVKGPELARRVAAVRPGVRVVFMSGYASGTEPLGAAGELPAQLLEKPFSVEELLRHVQAALA